MAELKYTYALDKNENCIGIGNAQKGIEYRCPHCKGEMVVKEGSIKVKHYAHKIRPQNCSYETYLHALAKKRIEEWFNSDSALNILKSATKLFSVLLASKRPLITELADKLRLKYPLLPTISPCLENSLTIAPLRSL